jgi:hypothetical protein
MNRNELPDWLKGTVGTAIASMNKDDAIRDPCEFCGGFAAFSPWPEERGVGVLVRVIASITHAEDCACLAWLRSTGLAALKAIDSHPGCYMRHIGTEEFIDEFVTSMEGETQT